MEELDCISGPHSILNSDGGKGKAEEDETPLWNGLAALVRDLLIETSSTRSNQTRKQGWQLIMGVIWAGNRIGDGKEYEQLLVPHIFHFIIE